MLAVRIDLNLRQCMRIVNFNFTFTFYFSESPTQTHRLLCYKCSSPNSWEECNAKSTVTPCPEGEDDACLTISADYWEFPNGTGRTLSSYAKYCSASDACSDKQCKQIGWKCTVKCCSHDMCNTGVAVLANIVSIAVVICLAVHNIFAFR